MKINWLLCSCLSQACTSTQSETCMLFSDGQSCTGMETLAPQPQQQQPVRLGQWNEPGPFLQGAVPPFTLPQQLAHLGQPGMRIPQQLLRANWGLGTAAEDEPRAPMPRSVRTLYQTGYRSITDRGAEQYVLFNLNDLLISEFNTVAIFFSCTHIVATVIRCTCYVDALLHFRGI